MTLRTALAAMLAALLLAGCAGEGEERSFDFPVRDPVDVDTKQLRQMKKDAGVEPCRPGPEPGASQLPAVTLPCFGGGKDVDLSTLEGPLVINFWANWCGPCREEMPALEEFHQKYDDRVPVIGINVRDQQPEAAMELVAETGVTYPLLADPEDLLPGREPLGTLPRLPMFAFVRADGSVQLAVESVSSLGEFEALVEKHLEVTL